MRSLLNNIPIEVGNHVYLKDPESSDLGKRIVTGSIDLIVSDGFEAFTFRKLGNGIGSPEASIYRYFESKQKLLIYLTSWYWRWMQYRLAFKIVNVPSAEDRLAMAIRLLTEEILEDSDFSHVNEVKLNRIVITESSKAFLNRHVDEENTLGAFAEYKKLVGAISDIILEINPEYKYPHMLVSTVVEGAHMQRHFAEHLPRLTDIIAGEDSITRFYHEMVFKAIAN